MALARPMADLAEPTLERRSRSRFVSAPAIGTEAEAARAGLRMYRALSTIERLLRDGSISLRQADAGERLRDDYELGIAGARDTAGSGSAIGWYYAEARLAACRSYQQAIAALGPLWRYVLPVCVGDEQSISALARTLKRNRQELAGLIKFGLDVLADHYGIR